MTKTPEELTAEWKAGKLPADDYFIKLINNDITTGFFDGLDFSCCAGFGIFQILAPIPAYDEYRAMQEELTYLKKPNGNYPDRISKLKSRIKHLLNLQENPDLLDSDIAR